MRISCVIINYNDSKRVAKLTKELLDYSFFEKIVIVDNKSNNEEINLLNNSLESYKNVKIILLEKNLGFNAGNNKGFEYLEKLGCDYVFSINSDIFVKKYVLEKIISFLEKNISFGACGCEMNEYGKNIASFYQFPTVHNEIMSDLGLRKIFKLKPKFNFDGGTFYDVDFIRSSLCCFRFEAIKKVNFFDENTFLYFGESILAKKLLNIGYKEAIIKNEFYNHNHIKSKSSLKLYLIGKKDRDYAIDKYFKMNKFNRIRLNISFEIGRILRFILKK